MEMTTARRGTLAICWFVAAAVIFRSNSINYIIGPAAQDFGLGGDGTAAFKLVPSIGQLLVVFLAGLLAERFGARRTIIIGSAALAVGGLVCAVAPGALVMNGGLLVAAAGTSTLMVSIFALVGRHYSGTRDRARAFGIVATAMPTVSLISPFICGWLADHASWRISCAIWALLGAMALALSLTGLPRDSAPTERNEYVTPLLAGIGLVALVELLNALSDDGLSIRVLVFGAIAVASLVGIVVARRAMAQISLSLEPVRHRLPLLMLLVVGLSVQTYQWYLGFLAFQHLYGLTDLQIAVAMIPTQIVCIAAARAIPKVIVARGLRVTAVLCLILTSASCLLFLLVAPQQSVIVLVVVMAVYAALATALNVSLGNAAMDALPKEHSGAMSSFRSAASAFGSAVGTVVMGVVLLGTYQASVAARSGDAGVDAATATAITTALNAGESIAETSAQVSVPSDTVSAVSDLSLDAMADALHAKSVLSMVIGLVAAGLLWRAMRRRDAQSGVTASVGQA